MAEYVGACPTTWIMLLWKLHHCSLTLAVSLVKYLAELRGGNENDDDDDDGIDPANSTSAKKPRLQDNATERTTRPA